MIKPIKLSKKDIWQEAETFREKYLSKNNVIPVPILDIVEFDLEMEIIPIPDLLSDLDIDGFLGNNLKTISIDKKMYWDERFENRLKFTLAHEVGHLVLHSDQISQCTFDNAIEWVKLRLEINEEDLGWFEWQAYEFGGRLLVPHELLKEEIDKNISKIAEYKKVFGNNNIEGLIDNLSFGISRTFGVSKNVISRRIKHEGFQQFISDLKS